jgi:WD40 repeat protein
MRILSGHTKDVRAVAFAPDGRLISAGNDRKVLVWDAVAGAVLHTIRAKAVVYALAVSAVHKKLAFAGRPATSLAEANTVKLWDLDKERDAGEYVWARTGWGLGSIWSLSFSADGRYLAGAARVPGAVNEPDGGPARWWELVEPCAEGVFHDDRVFAVAFGPAGSTIALTRERNIGLFDHPTGQELLSCRIQSTWAAGVAFVPSGNTLVVAASSFLHFIDTTGAARPQRVKSGLRTITSLAVSPDGSLLVVGGRPETLELYDTRTRSLKANLDFGLGAVHSVAFSPDGCTFAVGGAKGLMVCDVP